MPKHKKITMEELALMVKRGFDETSTKSDIARLEGDVARLDRDIAELRSDITRLGQFPEGLGRRLDRLEDEMRVVKTKVGIR